MRVTQTINIGTLRINSMSNSSIVQVGATGAIKTRAKEITEVIPQSEANQKLEGEITKAAKPPMDKEGIPLKEAPSVGKKAPTQQTMPQPTAPSTTDEEFTGFAGTGYQDVSQTPSTSGDNRRGGRV